MRNTRANIIRAISAATSHKVDACLSAALGWYCMVTVNAYLVGRGISEDMRKKWGGVFGKLATKHRRAADVDSAVLREMTTTGKVRTAAAYVGRDVRFMDMAWEWYVEQLHGAPARKPVRKSRAKAAQN